MPFDSRRRLLIRCTAHRRFTAALYRTWVSRFRAGPDQLPSVAVIISEKPVIRCVGAVIHDPRGRLLLVKRAHEPEKGKWSLPGGRVEQSESDHSAVRREVHEETGLSVTVGPLIGRVFRPGPKGTFEILDYSCWSSGTDLFPGDDAADAMWADGATFATLERQNALTTGLADALRHWDCLPRNE